MLLCFFQQILQQNVTWFLLNKVLFYNQQKDFGFL